MQLKLYRGKWAVVGYTDGKVWRRSLHTADRAQAERLFRDVRVETPGNLISDAVTIYLKEKRGRARSFEAMEASWKALKPIFGHLRPDQVTRDLCREFTQARRKQGRQDGTIIKDLSFLRAALKFNGKGDKATFEMPHAPPPRDRYLTRSEFARLLEACHLPHIKLFILLALTTAGRASAILELTWDRVDFKRGHIKLATGEGARKGRATVPITNRARPALNAAKKAAQTNHVIEWAGEPLKSVKRAFREACSKAGLKGITPHVLRHTAAVWMAEKRVPMHEIASYLGHTDARTTFKHYAQYSPDHLREASKALE